MTVNTGDAIIITEGANAHGIFAQSVGASGGVWASGDGVSAMTAGTHGGAGSDGGGNTVTVTVTQAGTLVASGYQATGIFAQSTGLTNEKNVDYPINGTVTVNGEVSGGTGPDAWGVWVDSTNSVNSINIAAGGLVRAGSRQAIQASGVGYNTVYNSGTVVGSYRLTTTLSSGTFSNRAGGVLVPQGTLTATSSMRGRCSLPAPRTIPLPSWRGVSAPRRRRRRLSAT